MWNKNEKSMHKHTKHIDDMHSEHHLTVLIFDIRYTIRMVHHASCLWVEDIAIDRLLVATWSFHLFTFASCIWCVTSDQEKYWNVCFCVGHILFRSSSTQTKIIRKMCNFALFSRCFWTSIFRYWVCVHNAHTHGLVHGT